MEKEIIILVENKNKAIIDFIDLIASKNYISFKELRKTFPNTSSYDTVQLFIYRTNNSIKSIYPNLDMFTLDFCKKGNKVYKVYNLNKNIKIKTTEGHIILQVQK